MVFNKTAVLFGVCSLSFLYFALWRDPNLGFRDFLLLGGRFLLLLAFLSVVISVITPRTNFFSPNVSTPSAEVPEDEKEKQQSLARKQQQEKHREKATAYLENVLKPRQESQFQKKEEHFYRMTGETWKLTEGHRLGEDEESKGEDLEAAGGTPNKEALRKRKLPENVMNPPPAPEPHKPKRVLVLPEEPTETAEGVVTIALRSLSGRTFRRRFSKLHNTQVLLDWMRKVGYPPEIYTLCTSYPRRPLEIGEELTLEDVGIAVDTVLNLEEKEISN